MRKNKGIIEQIETDLENNVYSGKSREHLMEDDEISPTEEAFMKGYEDAS